MGSYVKGADRLRVNAQLLTAASGEIVWSDKIDVPANDLISIQDTLAERVVSGLRVNLTEEEQERLDRTPTRNAEAYEFYLRARDVLFRYVAQTLDIADLDRAVSLFNESVGLDPDFAAAHAGLARCYIQHAQGYGGETYWRQAERSLRRALELDPQMTEARLYTVYVDLYEGDKERAESTVKALLEEAPNDSAVLLIAAMLCRLDGLYDRAMEYYDRLLALNPRDALLVTYSRARVQIHRGEYGQAIFELEAARSAEPDHALVKVFLALAQLLRGHGEDAEGLLDEVVRANPGFDAVQPLRAWCLAERGDRDGALALLTDRVREVSAADQDLSLWTACVFAILGSLDESWQWLQRAVRLGNEDYPLFASIPGLEGLHGDPRFQELIQQLRAKWEERLNLG
jgi:eukaryotic-like serine/threonine-protein kinase